MNKENNKECKEKTKRKLHVSYGTQIIIVVIYAGIAKSVIIVVILPLTTHNWQKWKSAFLTYHCHEIYREEVVDLKIIQLYLKIRILCYMLSLGQFC